MPGDVVPRLLLATAAVIVADLDVATLGHVAMAGLGQVGVIVDMAVVGAVALVGGVLGRNESKLS